MTRVTWAWAAMLIGALASPEVEAADSSGEVRLLSGNEQSPPPNAVVAAMPQPASQSVPKADNLSFNAEEVTYDKESGVATARGRVEIAHGERFLSADQISYNMRREVVTATGNVSLVQSDGEVLSTERLDLNDEMKAGVARGMRALIAERASLAGSGASSSGRVAQAGSTLSLGLSRILGEHPLMRSVDNDVAAAKEQIGVDRSAWFPRLSFRANGGKQFVNRDGTLDPNDTMRTLYSPREVGVTANQLIWDFGTVNSAINRSEMNHTKEQMERLTQRTNLVLAGIDAHLKLLKARLQFDYAVKSEENIKRQTQLEGARIEAGKGLNTDLLQAMAQLAGAKARRVAAQSAVDTATNRYRAVFGDDSVPQQLEAISEPASALPPSLEDALSLAEGQNPDIIAARARADLKDAERAAVSNKEWMPRLEFQYDAGEKSNNDGTAGTRTDQKMLVQATWSFDTGLKAKYAVDAATHAAASERDKAYYVGLQANEETKNAWTDLKAARERLSYLNEQVEISNRFLELARKERELGKRSLLDVLSGETNLINAQSEAAAAETDVVLASFRMLRAIGIIDPAHVVPAPPKAMAALSDPLKTVRKQQSTFTDRPVAAKPVAKKQVAAKLAAGKRNTNTDSLAEGDLVRKPD